MRTVTVAAAAVVLLLAALTPHASAKVTRASTAGAVKQVNQILKQVDKADRANLLRRATSLIRKVGRAPRGCAATVCFALDGSRFVSAASWRSQRVVAQLAVAILSADTGSSFAAAQYTRTTRAISGRTTKADVVVRKLGAARQQGGNSVSLSAALGYCGAQAGRGKGSAVVVAGSGRSTVGFRPGFVAGAIRRRGTDIVGVAPPRSGAALRRALGLKADAVWETGSRKALRRALRGVVFAACDF